MSLCEVLRLNIWNIKVHSFIYMEELLINENRTIQEVLTCRVNHGIDLEENLPLLAFERLTHRTPIK